MPKYYWDVATLITNFLPCDKIEPTVPIVFWAVFVCIFLKPSIYVSCQQFELLSEVADICIREGGVCAERPNLPKLGEGLTQPLIRNFFECTRNFVATRLDAKAER